MIELENVSLRAGDFSLEKISFSVEAGDYAMLMGRTGCGKTTILEAICGLRPVAGGRIFLHGDNVTDLAPAARNVGYVPQDLALFANMTVREHLAFAPRLRGATDQQIEQRITELSGLLGIGDLLDRKPRGLSGGESQRIALGRALSFNPPVLLLDEPMSALDDDTRAEIYALLKKVREETGVTTLHITHSRAEAEALGTRLFLVQNRQVTCKDETLTLNISAS